MYKPKETVQMLIDDCKKDVESFGQKFTMDDYWVKLLVKGENEPKNMTLGEAIELWVYVERIFQRGETGELKFAALDFRRHLNGVFGRQY